MEPLQKMISPLQNLQALQTILTVEHQLLANILQNLGPAEGQTQQMEGQISHESLVTGHESQETSHESQESKRGVMSHDSTAQTIKETGESLLNTKNDQASSLKEQIVSLAQTLVQQGHLPSSTLTQPPAVMIPQMLACLGKLHREEKKKQKKKKNRDKKGNQEDQNESPIDMLIRQVFKMHSPSK